MNWKDIRLLAVATILGLSGIGGSVYAVTENERQRTKQKEIEATYPSSYWEAKEAEIKANVDRYRIDKEIKKDLELVRMKKSEDERARKREFEKHAPKEYWDQKRIEEEEQTKRELNRQQMEFNRKQLEINRQIASESTAALRSSANRIAQLANNRNI